MKCVILLALVAVAFAQDGHRPGFDHGDPLHHLVMAEVQNLIRNNNGISETDCEARCDAAFDLAAGHDEQVTDHLCAEECRHQLQPQGPQTAPPNNQGPQTAPPNPPNHP